VWRRKRSLTRAIARLRAMQNQRLKE
jgi:hypothetical protein